MSALRGAAVRARDATRPEHGAWKHINDKSEEGEAVVEDELPPIEDESTDVLH